MLATTDEDDLRDEGTYDRLGFYDLDLSSRSAKAAEFRQCRFNRVDLSGTVLNKTGFTDSLVESGNLANLHAEGSSLVRVAFTGTKLTGLHWIDGLLRDVTLQECRLDLSLFRDTEFRSVLFTDCSLTRADFAGADLGGAHFVRCDLSGAQFSGAKMSGTRFSDCALEGVGGVASFAGASLSSADLSSLSYALADALGINVVDSPG